MFNPTDPISVLVVDDDPASLAAHERALVRRGFEVLTAGDAEAGLRILREKGPPMVITDWVMPAMDGLEFCRRIRADEGIGFTYVIILTANTEPAHLVAAFDAGADDYITKPFDPRTVVARLKAAERIVRLEAFYHRHTVELHRVNAEIAVMNAEMTRLTGELQRARTSAERAAAAAATADRTKSEFLANMSHEIRTPATAIIGFAELLSEHSAGSLDEESLDALTTIRRNADHLVEILSDLLDLSHIETGTLRTKPRECSPSDMIASMTTMMRERAESKGIDLTVEIDPQVPETISTEPARLRQILINLVGNAIKFTNHGTVRIVASSDPIVEGRSHVRFQVIDTGMGIAAKQLHHIFEPFTQADTTASRSHGGTGLGLAICRGLAETMGGKITVESKLGAGSTFTLTLPVTPGTAPAPPASPTTPRTLDGVRILLAEDGPDNQRLVVTILSRVGAEVDVAENGEIAVEKAMAAVEGGRPFDVILMDMQMPVLDGYQATRVLRRREYTRPVIALTAHTLAGAREKCLKAGCDGFLSKPIDRAKLIATVAEYRARTPVAGSDSSPERSPG